MKPGPGALPRMGLGMAALGRPGYINLNRSAVFGNGDRTVQSMQAQANHVLDKLFEAQQVWIDCARSYGKSEEFVGSYLRSKNVKPDSVFVSSKWGYTYVADWQVTDSPDPSAKHEVKDHSTTNFLKQVEETNELLGEYINLYQIHSATFDSGILTDTKAHEALAKCRQQRGWKIGLSVSGPDQDEIIRTAISITVGDEKERLFDSVQCTFNLLEQKPAQALQEAHDQGLDIIIKEGLANGRVFQSEKIRQLAEQYGCGVDQIALAYILAQQFQPRVLSGAVTPDQLESNLEAEKIAQKIFGENPNALSEIGEACIDNSESYWNERAALSWN